MFRKLVVTGAVAGLLAIGAGTASAQPPDPGPVEVWIPIFYFGTQTYCQQAGMFGEQNGALTPGAWKCDSGWLMVKPQSAG